MPFGLFQKAAPEQELPPPALTVTEATAEATPAAPTMEDLCARARQLRRRIGEIEAEELAAQAEIEALQLDAVAKGIVPVGLPAALAEKRAHGDKRAVIENALTQLKGQIGMGLSAHVNAQVADLARQASEIRQAQKALLPELYRRLARAAVLLQQLDGFHAAAWLRGGEIDKAVDNAIRRDRLGFIRTLNDARQEFPGDDLDGRLQKVTKAQRELVSRPQDAIMVEELILTLGHPREEEASPE
jgi:hypothetical protein